MSDGREPVVPGDELPEGDYLTWTCGAPLSNGQACNTVTQGGRRGLALHRRVVHADTRPGEAS